MTRKAELIRKELSPKFPEWTSDFRDFLQWQYHGTFGPDMDEDGIWDSMEELLDKGSAAFHNLYRINEALWKKRH